MTEKKVKDMKEKIIKKKKLFIDEEYEKESNNIET